MTSSKPGFHVVVGVEFSGRGDEALAEACDLALAHDGVIHAVYVTSPAELEEEQEASQSGRSYERPAEATARRIWHRVQHVAGGHGWEGRRMQVWAHIRLGAVPKALLEVARRVDASVIVVGSDGNHRWLDRVLSGGSVVEPLHRRSDCSVLLARRKRPSSIPPPPVVRSERRVDDLARFDRAKFLSFGER